MSALSTRVVRPTSATFVNSNHPNREYNVTARDRMRVQSGEVGSISYLRFMVLLSPMEQLVSAHLEFDLEEDYGSETFRVWRVDSEGRSYGQLNYNNKPAPVAGAVQLLDTHGGRDWSFDVTTDAAAGVGGAVEWHITCDNTTRRYIKGTRDRRGWPRLRLVTEPIPTEPTDLSPDGVVSLAKPWLRWATRPGFDRVQVQFDQADGDFSTPVYDTGGVAGTEQEFDTGTVPDGFRNLVPNPSFELDTLSWATAAGVTLTRQPETGTDGVGSYVGEFTTSVAKAAGDWLAFTNALPVVAGEVFTGHGRVRRVTTGAGTEQARLAVRFYDAADAILGTHEVTVSALSGSPTMLNRATVVGVTAPAGATYARLAWAAAAALVSGSAFRVDAHMLVDAATYADAGGYFDGSVRGFWSGTPHNSVSTVDGWPGLAADQELDWRVRCEFSSGWSVWSDPATITRILKQAPVITNPGPTDSDPTPPVVWTPPADQQSWEVLVVRGGRIVERSGIRPGTDSTWTPEKGATREGQAVIRHVRTYGPEDRVPTPGDPPYAVDSVETVWAEDPTVPSLDAAGLVQTNPGGGDEPRVRFTWERSTVPDEVSFGYTVNGHDRLIRVPGDEQPYDWTFPPNTDVQIRARAWVNGQMSTALVFTARTKVTGMWLIDPDTYRGVLLAGTDLEFAYGSVTATYTPHNAAALIRRTSALRGVEGGFTGTLIERPGRSIAEQLEDVWWLREQPQKTLRLIVGDLNIPVTVAGINALFDPETSFATDPGAADRMRHRVSFEFAQTGDELPVGE